MISVVTQARRAIDAQQENATRSEAVVTRFKTAAGAGAEMKTSGYSVQPQRVYKENQPPTITGYEARNTVTVTLSDLKKLGNVIDVASQAGANDISGISFTLQQDRAAREQALTEATREAMNKARTYRASTRQPRRPRSSKCRKKDFKDPRYLSIRPKRSWLSATAPPRPSKLVPSTLLRGCS